MIRAKITKIIGSIFTVLVIIILNPVVTEACPGCNTALTGTVSRGFNMSILFLMAMPFFVAGSLVVGLICMRRSKNNAIH